ncbi:condensation domain-containing protein, partial [Nonomuraea sp. LPB2021202275-12-8]|uniref:condensation domain-containing protein n=1 Tax=Nonomuraea sp. LPB2021202275-12-8 TaxID=3120159 RepID=UPI00300CFFFA
MPRPERLPLSYVQRRMWFVNQTSDQGQAHHVRTCLRLTGPLDRGALEAAVGDLVDRHEVLRTLLPEHEGQPYQLVLTGEQARPTIRSVTAAPGELREVLEEVARAPFDLVTDLPLRVFLAEVGVDEHVLLLVAHHIACDGWSMAPLARDLATAYEARLRKDLPGWEPLEVQYADYTLWMRQLLGDEADQDSVIAGQVAYWRETLRGLPDQLELPTDRPRPPVASHRGDTILVNADADLHRDLLALAQHHRASLFMVVQAALAALLNRLGAGTDIPVGTPVAGRTDAALDDLVGCFINLLVLRADVSGEPTFAELLDRVRQADLAAFSNQDLPFERLVETLNPARSLARHPLFQVLLVHQNNTKAELEFAGLSARTEPVSDPVAEFDLTLDVLENHAADGRPDGIHFCFE